MTKYHHSKYHPSPPPSSVCEGLMPGGFALLFMFVNVFIQNGVLIRFEVLVSFQIMIVSFQNKQFRFGNLSSRTEKELRRQSPGGRCMPVLYILKQQDK